MSRTIEHPKRKGNGKQTLHMTFRLSPSLRNRLVKAAKDRTIGDEIRRRLENSFLPDGDKLRHRILKALEE